MCLRRSPSVSCSCRILMDLIETDTTSLLKLVRLVQLETKGSSDDVIVKDLR